MDFKKADVISGLIKFLSVETHYHKLITAGWWSNLDIKPIGETAAYFYVERLWGYVTKATLNLQETELYPEFKEIQDNTDDIKKKIRISDAVLLLHELVMRVLAKDVKEPLTGEPDEIAFVRFVYSAYARYRIDFPSKGMFRFDKKASRKKIDDILFTYGEFAYAANVKIETVSSWVNKEIIKPTYENELSAYNNNFINDALKVGVEPLKTRNAFVDVFQVMSYLMSTQRCRFIPTKVTLSKGNKNKIPKYWEKRYWKDEVLPIFGNRKNKNKKDLAEFAGLSNKHLEILDDGKAGLCFLQAYLIDIWFYFNLFNEMPLYPFQFYQSLQS